MELEIITTQHCFILDTIIMEERDIHNMGEKKIYGMKKQWESIEHIAKLR
jgi:hypothetical protein